MAKGLITYQTLSDIADAIRTKLETQDTYKPSEMAEAVMSISGGGSSVTIVPFASGTDEEIVAMIEAAHNGDIDLQQDGGWAVGDTRTISISAFTAGNVSIPQQDIDIVISQFGDYNSCGCVMQFDFKDALDTFVRMNSTRTKVGGYGSSEMKMTTLPALVNALPSWLKDLLLEFSVLASEGSASSTIATVTGNKLALRSEVEVRDSNSYSISGEGEVIEYYKTSSNRTKKKGHSGSNNQWWTRSPKWNNSNEFVIISSSGTGSVGYADYTNCVAPFGCL